MDTDKLGYRSLLVLMKLGHDLRPSYQEMIDGDLPPQLSALADKLLGYAEFREVPDGGEAS